MQFTSKDFKRYSKQIILKKVSISGQKKIFASKVLVIGAGGLGCPLILYLANSGVGNIGIADHDRIEISNLNRQILYTHKDVGKFKATQAKKIIKNINNKIKVDAYIRKISKKNISKILHKFDVICDGTDNFSARYLINDYCLKNKKILISAAISKFDGQIFNFDFRKKIPCFRCFMPETPENVNNCETEGVEATNAGIAGCLQANEVIKIILNIESDLVGKILIFNTILSRFRKVKISRNPNCVNKCIKK